MNGAVIQADGAIGLTAVSACFGYVNVANVFERDELCAGKSALNGIKPPDFRLKNASPPESFHPDEFGHAIVADEVAELLGDPVIPSAAITPQQAVTRSLYVCGRSFYVNSRQCHVEMFGADVDPAGELVTCNGIAQPVPNAKPTARFTTTKSGSA